MFVIINGSFGIGKSTLAMSLSRLKPGWVISDPERVGFVLRRMPPPLLGWHQRVDYQDMSLWRCLIAVQAKSHLFRARAVLIPMAFTNRSYLSEFEARLIKAAPVLKLCLVAPLDTIRSRLAARAKLEGRMELTAFELRRSSDCVAAHRDEFFGHRIDATQPPLTVLEQAQSVIEAAQDGLG